MTSCMHGIVLHSIGVGRAECNIRLTNLVYNACRCTILKRKDAYIGKLCPFEENISGFGPDSSRGTEKTAYSVSSFGVCCSKNTKAENARRIILFLEVAYII